jgi:hypothetical protein
LRVSNYFNLLNGSQQSGIAPVVSMGLGVGDDIDLPFYNVGLHQFIFHDVPTYRRLPLHFFEHIDAHHG